MPSSEASAEASAGAGAPPATVAPEPFDTIVLWTRKRAPGPRGRIVTKTYFLGSDGAVVSTRPGAHVAVGRDLWRWSVETRTSKGERCEMGQANPFPDRKLERATLVPVGAGGVLEVAPLATPTRDGDLPAEGWARSRTADAAGLGVFSSS